MSEQNRGFSADRAREIGERIGIDWDRSLFDVEQFRIGLEVELEQGAETRRRTSATTMR